MWNVKYIVTELSGMFITGRQSCVGCLEQSERNVWNVKHCVT